MQERRTEPGRPVPAGSVLLKGAAVLGAAAVISKLLGTLQKIPLQNVAGDATYGIYSAVYPYYILVLFLATAGFPVAVSKFVSERTAVGDTAGARRVLRVAGTVLGATGVAAFALLYFGAGWMARLIANEQTEAAIRSVSFALLIVPAMSVLRGYFQGLQDMVPTGVSQVAEQFARVAAMLALLLYLTAQGAPANVVAAGQTFGSAVGALAGLGVMLWFWRRERRRVPLRPAVSAAREPFWPLAGKIALYALPVCLGAVVVPILNMVDTFTMPRLLKAAGLDEQAAMERFGVYCRGLTPVQLVAMVASSVSVAIVPAVSNAKMRGARDGIRARAELSLRLTWLIGLAASVGLCVAARPINIMLYTDSQGTSAMAILAFSAVFGVLNIVSASILQGCGSVVIPAVHLLAAAVLKVALNLLLMPVWGIEGAAFAAVAAFAFASLLNLAALRRALGVRFVWANDIVKPAAAVALMALCVAVWIIGWREAFDPLAQTVPYRAQKTFIALTAVAFGAAVYAVFVFKTGAVREADLRLIPGLETRWIPKLKKWKLL